MEDENDTRASILLGSTYCIKTSEGYYFTEGRGYIRFYGTALQADALCAKHADEAIELVGNALRKAGHNKFYMMRVIYPDHVPCKVCEKLGGRNGI